MKRQQKKRRAVKRETLQDIPSRVRDELERDFASMQTPAARAGMKRAWEATPKELGEAAVRGCRKRKKV